jgi:ABC-type multidrug transport system ATPase subunit
VGAGRAPVTEVFLESGFVVSEGHTVADGDYFLQAQGLHFAYPECAVLNDVSFDLNAGLALVQGDESSGKTTLLRVLSAELAPQTGEVTLRGISQRAQPAAYRSQIFWQDPRSSALDELTARQWLGSLPAQHPAWDAAALAQHVTGFSLEPHLDKPFYALSTGSRRKVLMAGALASGSALTLIDEPVAGLDKPSIAHLVRAFSAVARQANRLVVVAHYEPLRGVPWEKTLVLSR